MKTTTFDTNGVDFEPLATTDSGLSSFLKRTLAAWDQAREERRLRRNLAELDQHILNDIGIGDGEIGRR